VTPPTFDHAPECTSHYSAHANCDCGATDRKAAYEAGWNGAVKAALDCVVDVANDSPSNTATNALTRAAVAIRKLKKETTDAG
jgi:hypothetical protein